MNRLKKVLCNEEGSILLEQVVLIGILIFIITVLLVLVFRMKAMTTAQSGYSTTTGWFRTENATGMRN